MYKRKIAASSIGSPISLFDLDQDNQTAVITDDYVVAQKKITIPLHH